MKQPLEPNEENVKDERHDLGRRRPRRAAFGCETNMTKTLLVMLALAALLPTAAASPKEDVRDAIDAAEEIAGFLLGQEDCMDLSEYRPAQLPPVDSISDPFGR